MLSLSLRQSGYVQLILPDGSQIRVQVERFQGRSVRLSFDAPKEVTILRDSLYERWLDEQDQIDRLRRGEDRA